MITSYFTLVELKVDNIVGEDLLAISWWPGD